MLDKLNPEEFKRSGLLAVKFEPTTSADFIFASFVAESLKNGRAVVYVSGSRSSESFRIAANKMSVRLDAQTFSFIELGKLLGTGLEESIRPKLLEEIDKICVKGQQKSTLFVLDNLQLIGGDDLNDEISLLLDIQKRVNAANSLVAFGTCREIIEYGFRIPLQIDVKPVGSGFGKRVGGQIDITSYRSDFDTLPASSVFHYSVGERSIQLFYPGTASVL